MEYYDTFSELTPEDKLAHVKDMRDQAWWANLEWLEEAEKCHRFKSGDQWSDSDKAKLEAQGRTPLVWNYIHAAIELILGVRAQNPTRIYPYPVEKNDDFLCEILEDIVTYIDTNQVDAENEEAAMFENGMITGIGDVVVDVGPDPNNPEELQFYQSSLEAYEVLVDPVSRKANLDDARYIIYEKWVTAEDFKIRYPKHIKDMEEIFTQGSSGLYGDLDSATSYVQNDYTNTSLFEYFDQQNKRILVAHYEYKEAYKRYYYVDEQGKSLEITKKEVKQAKLLPGSIAEIYDTKVRWMHYIHDRILWEGDSPVYKKSFSLCRLSAYTDKSKRQQKKYGVVKLMIDPQTECNKRWMHTLKLLGKQGVGVMAEIDAFHDLKQATDSWSDVDAITFMAKGGLNKIKEKTVPDFPAAPMKLEEMNQAAMKHISGINPDLMGMAQQRREPGINLRLRQRQGMTMLSKLFENNKFTLKEIYKRKLEIISRYMPDTQIRKILGETAKYTFEQGYIIDRERGLIAPIRKIRDLNYNIRMEDAPGGMNKMMSEFTVFMDMMEKGFPTDPNVVIDKLDLSPLEKADWKAYIEKQQQGKQQAQKAELDTQQAKIQVNMKQHTDKMQIEQIKLKLLAEGKGQDLKAKVSIEADKIEQSDVESKRDFALAVAQMDAAEKKDMIDILKFVSQEQGKLTSKSETGYTGANVKPTVNG